MKKLIWTGWSMDHLQIAQTSGLSAACAALLFVLSVTAWRIG
ncbi:hypothetical protein [Paenibacillus sp. FSL R7-0179]